MPRGIDLIEREESRQLLMDVFSRVREGEGHTVLVAGEAGIGKTSLVQNFIANIADRCLVLEGACDSSFTPRPLGPLYDFADRLGDEFTDVLFSGVDRSTLFFKLMDHLRKFDLPLVVFFEDVHWADEATIDLIKFLGRRIIQLPCMFILTYRDNEIHSTHPFSTIAGQLPGSSFTKLKLEPFTRETVVKLARQSGRSGSEVYHLTAGNPFYVTELLQEYSKDIPDNIKDFIGAFYYAKTGAIREIWELASIVPNRIPLDLLGHLVPDWQAAADTCMREGIMVLEGNSMRFKHDLYRIAISDAMTPVTSAAHHRRIIDYLLAADETMNAALMVHHAVGAHNKPLVIEFAPKAAADASSLGAHNEAARLYELAINNVEKEENTIKADLIEKLVYELYLVHRTTEAINNLDYVLKLRDGIGTKAQTGNNYRWLSRLWWFGGNRTKAVEYARLAIQTLEKSDSLENLGWAYSNMAQLKMLSEEAQEVEYWGNKALEIATVLNNNEIFVHASNNIGSSKMRSPSTFSEGEKLLKSSLVLALEEGMQEHVARAYTNLGYNLWQTRNYQDAADTLNDGIQYCLERDLDTWTWYMQMCLVTVYLNTAKWDEALSLGHSVLQVAGESPIVAIGIHASIARILTRKGMKGTTEHLTKAIEMAIPSGELQRIHPVAIAALEYIYHNGSDNKLKGIIGKALEMLTPDKDAHYRGELAFWLRRCNMALITGPYDEPFKFNIENKHKDAVTRWHETGDVFYEALSIVDSAETGVEAGINLLKELGADATVRALQQDLRKKGAKSIPRGQRKSTLSNSAHLTRRQIEILELLQEGLQNKEIAERLFISPKTVDHHISAILEKLDVNSRHKAVAQGKKIGLLSDNSTKN